MSWLAFNERVLQEAGDKSVPVYERLKFLAIYSSNLDEFYRVRVSHHKSLLKLKKALKSEFHLNPKRVLESINRKVYDNQQVFRKIFRTQILAEFEKNNIALCTVLELDKSQKAHIHKYYKKKVQPLLTLHQIMPGNPPFIENRVIYFVVSTVVKGFLRKLYLLKIPHKELGRFTTVPSTTGLVVVQLEDIVRYYADSLIKKGEIVSMNTIKISRDADLHLEDEFGDSIVEKIKKSLAKRSTGFPTRFQYDEEMPSSALNRLIDCYDLKKQDLIPGGRYHNFHDFMEFPKPENPKFFYEPLPVLKAKEFHDKKDPFKVIRSKDVLLSTPYQDYKYVVNFLNNAIDDNCTKSISITLYRVARDSKICLALEKAAHSGIDVTVFDEVQARFDEESNLYWGNRLTKAGARVLYSLRKLKVHTKLLLIEREEDNITRYYSFLSTGNFHEKTAKIYCDHNLFTANKEIGIEVRKVFSYLEKPRANFRYKHLLVAPYFLRNRLEEFIDREIENAHAGKKAEIFLKMNSLEDKVMIRKLYDASEAGVKIKIIVRGICCLIPGVKGMSKNIKVISIVDRYLEHSRIFSFHNDGDPVYYLSSADLMNRNLSRRVEVAFPILDKDNKNLIKDHLKIQWSDNVKARKIDAEQLNKYKKSSSKKKVRAQYAYYNYLKERHGT
ncbi:MAG: polyphosphate kinase 1 [Flavobacteriales bacterium]|nr:polyphosphate kinase 1 [Flavobacteriales bacterium]